MKKILIYSITLFTFVVTATLNVHMMQKTNNAIDLTMITLESVSDDENSTGGNIDIETGGGIGDEPTCRSIGGYWNMALICTRNDKAEVTCSEHGKLSFLGNFITGSYEVGKKYTVLYELWNCMGSSGNCCKANAQGTKILGVI